MIEDFDNDTDLIIDVLTKESKKKKVGGDEIVEERPERKMIKNLTFRKNTGKLSKFFYYDSLIIIF